MALGVKLLMLGAALTGVSCGGYVVYKNVSGSSAENSDPDVSKENGEAAPTVKSPSADGAPEGTGGPKQQ